MAGVFYARYVPPTVNHQIEESSQILLEASNTNESEPRQSRKRKWSTKVKVDGRPDDLSTNVKLSPLNGLPTDDSSLGRDGEGGILEESKHARIKSKFEKSQKIAATVKKQSRYINTLDVVRSEDSAQQNESKAIHAEGLTPIPQPRESTPPPTLSAFSALPEWIRQPTVVPSSLSVPFEELHLSDSALESLKAKGFENAFAIQASVIPMLLDGSGCYVGDICMSAATGSGKTLAYTLPIVEALTKMPYGRLRALVVVPTRELVAQVQESFQISTAGTQIAVGTAVGNRTMEEEQKSIISRIQKYDPKAYQELRQSPANDDYIMEWPSPYEDSDDELDTDVDFVRDYASKVGILICTPGRLVEHMKYTKGFTLDHIDWLVIDEVDKLLDHSFQQWIEKVIPALEYKPFKDPSHSVMDLCRGPDYPRRVKKIILSATMTREISKLVPLKLCFPRLVVMRQELSSLADELEAHNATNIDHGSLAVPTTLSEIAIAILGIEQKPLYLLRLLTMDPKSLLEQKGRRKSISASKQRTASLDSDSDTSSTVSSSTETESSLDSGSISESSILSNYNPKEPLPKIPSTLIFTHSSESALRLRRLLSLLNPSLEPILHTLTKSKPSSRLRTIFKGLSKKPYTPLIIIASDRASRGLDISHLAQVINYDMPTSATTYVHRVGRTARAGRRGRAITFVEKMQGRWFWGEIGRGDGIQREEGKAVKRIDWRRVEFGKEEKQTYEEALGRLGIEARGPS